MQYAIKHNNQMKNILARVICNHMFDSVLHKMFDNFSSYKKIVCGQYVKKEYLLTIAFRKATMNKIIANHTRLTF